VGICQLNDRRICVGCWRSVDEIAAWSRLDEAERRAVLLRVETRARAAGAAAGE
jgi:predicted Fe-S protein YdhL (DUF1289 family)